MKKLFTFILCAVTAIAARAQFSGSGNGTAADPYRIYTDIHLAQMANFLNQEGVVFELMKDVDLTSYIAENSPSQGWTPIGVASTPFMGVLKGNNHTISGLYINRPSTNDVGLFGYIKNATITDVQIKGSSVTGGEMGAGSIVGTAHNSKIAGGSINMTGTIKGKQNVGSIAGKASNCRISSFQVETAGVSGTSHTGGCIGYMTAEGSIADCSAITTISGSTTTGGVVGLSENGTITNCSIVGDVTGSGDYTGGIAGYIKATNISNTQSKGNVSGKTSVGGIASVAEGTCDLTNLSSTGNIVGNSNVGGIVGFLLKSSIVTFESCHSKGLITNTGDYTGGIVGNSNGICINSMDDCSHFGDIKGNNYVGGLVGAVLSIEATDPRSTYVIKDSYNNVTATYTDQLVTGSTTPHKLNNCTAIGNIEGGKYVGGLIGESLFATAYTSTTVSKTYVNNNYDGHAIYLWKDGSYTGTYGFSEITFDMKKYTKGVSAISLVNSYYSGKITASEYVGGLAGHKTSGDIVNCFTYATIAGKANVGGIAGKIEGFSSTQQGVIKSSVANNASITASDSNVGRIFGSKGENVTIGVMASAQGNRALTQTNVMLCGIAQDVIDDEQNGTSVGPSMLKLKANYVSWGWDFDKNWNILETECFPYKKYQAAPPIIDSKLESQDTKVNGRSINGGTVYMYYKDREAVSTVCDGNNWAFTTDALQSGAQVQLYADVEDMTPSYLTSAIVKYPGSGTEEDPYRIYTAEDLQGASNSGYYKLMNDIDLTTWINENSPEKGWPAIGRNSSVATYINGDGHKISGLWINTTEGYNGLFSNYSAGYIKNLTVEVAAGKSVKGGDYTGVLIGRMANGQIINCIVKGTAEGTIHTGGVVGYAVNSEISGTSFDGTVKSSTASAYVGGISGYVKKVPTAGSNARATISTTGNTSYVGGLYGKSESGSIVNSYANAAINATGSSDYVGGLVGYSESPVSLSYSTGEVQATGADSYTGGLIGYAKSPVANSYSTVIVKGTYYVAGLVGYTFSTIDNCYAKGDVTGSRYGAGLVGQLDGSAAAVTSSVAANNILTLTDQASWGCRVIGGFKNGCVEPTLGSNLALSTMQVSLNGVAQRKTDDNIEGVATSESDLQSSVTYEKLGWDMSKSWGIDEGQMYPYLLWEVEVIPVEKLSLDKTTCIVEIGNTVTIIPNIQPSTSTNKRLAWTTSDATIATVENGVVTAIKPGEVTITASTTDGSNLSATCVVTVVDYANPAIAELQTLVNQAQALYDNSVEGNNIGQYAAGSRAALLTVINSVQAKISSTMRESEIAECTELITNAIATFKSKQIMAGADTDLSLYDDVVYFSPAESSPGQKATLVLQMKNAKTITGFQADVLLPDGLSFVFDEYGFAEADLLEVRTSKKAMTFETELQADGSLRLLAYSSKNYAFSGNDGEVATVSVNISSELSDGEYPIILKNIVLTEASGKTTKVDNVKTTLIIISSILGDANGDNEVNVGDLATTASYILGNPPANFVFKGADANEDNEINVGDLAKIAGIILGTSSSKAPKRAAETEASFDMSMMLEPMLDNRFLLHVGVDNMGVLFSGFQFNLNLPDGLNVKTDADGFAEVMLSTDRTNSRKTDLFDCSFMEDGQLRVLCASSHNSLFEGESGEVATILLEADSSFDAQGIIALRNIVYTATGEGEKASDVELNIANAISSIEMLNNSTTVTIYDMNGSIVKRGLDAEQWLETLPHGIYVVDGKKVVR